MTKAVDEIEQELRSEKILKNAAESMRIANALLREELLIDILDGQNDDPRLLETNFTELEMEFDAEDSVFMAIGKVNRRENSLSTHKELYKVKTFIHEYFGQYMNCISVIYERRIVWILQPRGNEKRDISPRWGHKRYASYGTWP